MIWRVAALVFLGLAGLFGALFWAQYVRWLDCFDAQGRCFDPDTGVVYHAQSGGVWLALAGMSLAGFGLLMSRARRNSRLDHNR